MLQRLGFEQERGRENNLFSRCRKGAEGWENRGFPKCEIPSPGAELKKQVEKPVILVRKRKSFYNKYNCDIVYINYFK